MPSIFSYMMGRNREMKKSEMEKIYKNVLNNPFIGITITDSRGVCCFVNDAQQRISGVPEVETVGSNMIKMADENIFSISSTAEVLLRKEEVNLHQTSRIGKSYDIKAVPIFDDNGDVEYVINYILDVTELYKFKEMVEHLEENNKKSYLKYQELLKAHDNMGEIVYYSKKMEKVIALCEKVAVSDATVLIMGSSGSGKELIADLIHEKSSRREHPFVKLNCAAIPETLLESELFGYEKGSFTGGNPKGKKGLFETADGGSLLLDEIGEMPLALQAKLLRVLQDSEVRRIGSEEAKKVNVRIIASTNSPLEQMIQEKKFREDLYYRLNVIAVQVPDLCERKEDIPILIGRFVQVFNKKYGLNKTLRGDAVNYMTELDYPGNVRELRNLVERLILQSPRNEITLNDVFEICGYNGEVSEQVIEKRIDRKKPLKQQMEEYEREVIAEYIKLYGRTYMAAEALGIDRSTLTRKLNKYNL